LSKHAIAFSFWPLLATIGWPLALMIVSIVPVIGYLLFVPMAAVWLWAPSVAFVFCLAIWWLWQRAWRRFLSAIVFPLVMLAAFLNYDMIHLWVMVPAYRLEIAKLPADHGPRLRCFDSEGFASTSFGALYNERSLPLSARRHGRSELMICFIAASEVGCRQAGIST
jgi:hypothetical protein